jgi:hypothetical protein
LAIICKYGFQHLISFLFDQAAVGIGITLLIRIFTYLSIYRFLVGKQTTLPIEIFVASAEIFNFVYILMMIVGYQIEAEQKETLEIARKLINKTTRSELIEIFRGLAEVVESTPIQCSCGFFILNLDIFFGVI